MGGTVSSELTPVRANGQVQRRWAGQGEGHTGKTATRTPSRRPASARVLMALWRASSFVKARVWGPQTWVSVPGIPSHTHAAPVRSHIRVGVSSLLLGPGGTTQVTVFENTPAGDCANDNFCVHPAALSFCRAPLPGPPRPTLASPGGRCHGRASVPVLRHAACVHSHCPHLPGPPQANLTTSFTHSHDSWPSLWVPWLGHQQLDTRHFGYTARSGHSCEHKTIKCDAGVGVVSSVSLQAPAHGCQRGW